MKLSENDSGKTVEIVIGDELEVILQGNPTTGYIWELSSLDSSVLVLNQNSFMTDDKTIGSGSMEVIRFDAVAVGKCVLGMIFHRPFEHNTLPLKTFEVTVIIKK